MRYQLTYKKKNTTANKVVIRYSLHRYIHTKKYYYSIYLNFPEKKLEIKSEAHKKTANGKLESYKIVLRYVSSMINGL